MASPAQHPPPSSLPPPSRKASAPLHRPHRLQMAARVLHPLLARQGQGAPPALASPEGRAAPAGTSCDPPARAPPQVRAAPSDPIRLPLLPAPLPVGATPPPSPALGVALVLPNAHSAPPMPATAHNQTPP